MTLNATLAPDSTYMLQMVRDDPLAVGYLSSGLLTDAVRAVAIEGIPLTAETIENQLYRYAVRSSWLPWVNPLNRCAVLSSGCGVVTDRSYYTGWVLFPLVGECSHSPQKG